MIFPDLYLRSIFDITPKLLRELNVKALILDVDNTLRICGSLVPFAGVLGWVDSMKKAGIGLIIASNNLWSVSSSPSLSNRKIEVHQ